MTLGSPTPSASTIVSTTVTRKKRTIVVVRRPRDPESDDDGLRPAISKQHDSPDDHDDDDGNAPASPPLPKKKTVFVARRPRPSEGKLFEHAGTTSSHGSLPGRGDHHLEGGGGGGGNGDGLLSTAPRVRLEWHPDGRVLEKSVLGTAAAFEEVRRRTHYCTYCTV